MPGGILSVKFISFDIEPIEKKSQIKVLNLKLGSKFDLDLTSVAFLSPGCRVCQ